jgi:hypothetical protein
VTPKASPGSDQEAKIRQSLVERFDADQAARQAGRCLASTKAQQPCRGIATGDGFCPWHSPATNSTLKRAWRRKGGLTRQRATLAQEIAAVAPTLPPGVELPPTPAVSAAGAPDWSSATKCRTYLQNLAIQVATGQVTVSVAEALRKLCESTLKVLDLEMDAELMGQLEDEE